MKLPHALIHELAVAPGSPAALDRRDTAGTRTDWLGQLGVGSPRDVADQHLEQFREELAATQQVLYAADRWSLLLVFQGLDASGKDGTIKHVLSGVDPQGCDVHSFKQPSETELRHDFLWRCATALPERGRIGIFNRSHYEEVLVVRVHPELLAAERIPRGAASAAGGTDSQGAGGADSQGAGGAVWRERYEDINAFERHLERCGTRVVKIFLHVSEAEQRRRLLERLDQPEKQWKFSGADLAEHHLYGDYQRAYEEALTATSTSWAPWYVVPADHKHALRALVGGIVVHVVEQLHLAMPVPDAAQRAAIEAARHELEA